MRPPGRCANARNVAGAGAGAGADAVRRGAVDPVRSVLAVVRFLKGLAVRAVWCEMRLTDHIWCPTNEFALELRPPWSDEAGSVPALRTIFSSCGKPNPNQ